MLTHKMGVWADDDDDRDHEGDAADGGDWCLVREGTFDSILFPSNKVPTIVARIQLRHLCSTLVQLIRNLVGSAQDQIGFKFE